MAHTVWSIPHEYDKSKGLSLQAQPFLIQVEKEVVFEHYIVPKPLVSEPKRKV
jgi:hypothetical protein